MDQLTKFDRALRDFSAASGGQERGIDGMLVTKWDTVDDKVWGFQPNLLSPFTLFMTGRARVPGGVPVDQSFTSLTFIFGTALRSAPRSP